jgi:hypothetical protein
MNANGALRFPRDSRFTAKTRVDYRRIFSSVSITAKAMTSLALCGRIFGAALGAASMTAVAGLFDPAIAAQGPGTNAGTASGATQLAMAVVVYGMSALVIAAGLIGAVRGPGLQKNASKQKYRKQPHAQ